MRLDSLQPGESFVEPGSRRKGKLCYVSPGSATVDVQTQPGDDARKERVTWSRATEVERTPSIPDAYAEPDRFGFPNEATGLDVSGNA